MLRLVLQRSAVVVLLTAFALVSLLPGASAAASDTGSSRSGLHEQWQPQTENDPRLQQPVQIEIIGRAAAPALKLLSEETGVALGVVPEDLGTVGERKFTVIAQGCSLKAIMVQLCEALQECHWDVDTAGSQPVYLLHRNGSADSAMVQAMEDDQRRLAEVAKPERTARVEAAREALAMTPEELAELAKTDPLLAAAARSPEWRSRMEMFFSLPQEKMEEFLSTGKTEMALADSPKRVQTGVSNLLQAKLVKLQAKLEKAKGTESQHIVSQVIERFSAMLGKPDEIGIGYDDRCLASGMAGILLCISGFGAGGSDCDAIPPRTFDGLLADDYRDLLLKTGTDAAAAEAVLADLVKQYEVGVVARRDRKRELEWREARNPELRRTVTLPFTGRVEPVEVQRFIAKETGLSLVSDYFVGWGPQEIPEEAKTTQPIWRLLYLLGESWFPSFGQDQPSGYEWNEVGAFLVFHDRAWYYRAPKECSESLVLAYQEKLEHQGHLTLDDAAAFLAELDRRTPTHPKLQAMFLPSVPGELMEAAGLSGCRPTDLERVRLYAALTPAQREKAQSAAGLLYQEMTHTQQELVRRGSIVRKIDRPTTDEEISHAVYRVTQSGLTAKLAVEFPSRKAETTLEFHPAAPEPGATAQP